MSSEQFLFFCFLRAKAPEPLPDTGDEDEIDFEDVRLDLCKFITSHVCIHKRLVNVCRYEYIVCVVQITVTCILR